MTTRTSRPNALKPAQIKEMLESEVQTLRKLSKELRKPNCRIRVPLPDFVERCFILHRDLIERWGGWRYRGAEVQVRDPSFLQAVAQQEFNAFHHGVAAAVRNKELMEWGHEVFSGFSISRDSLLSIPSTSVGPAQMLSCKNLQAEYPIYADSGGSPAYIEHVAPEARVFLLNRYRPTTAEEQRMYGTSRLEPVYATIRRDQRISSAVIRRLQEVGAPEVLIGHYEKLFQRLGEQVWGSTTVPVRCTLSCAPSSFIRLGEYGENSCYQNGGGHEYSKYWLASDCANSFVALFHRLKLKADAESDETSIGGRAWGIACPERGGIVSNFYLLPRNMVLPCLKETLGAALHIGSVAEVNVAEEGPLRSNSWARDLGRALYINSDTTLLARPSVIKQKLLDRYLSTLIRQGLHYGLYAHRGQGPQFLRLAPNSWDISGPSHQAKRFQVLWPYKDVDLKTLLVKSISEHGAFSPLGVRENGDDEPF